MTFALGILAAFLCLAIHELGHLVAGLSFGYSFAVYIVGPLRIDRGPANHIRFGWNRVPWLFGGIAAALPNRTDGLRWRMAVVAAAGPIANILLAVAASVLLASGPASGPWRTELQAPAQWPVRHGRPDAHLAAAAIAFDRGSYDSAGNSYAAAVAIASRLPAYVAGGTFVEAAWFEARRGAGAARARELLARTPEWVLMLPDADRLRAEAAIAHADGDHERAKALAERALEISPPQSAGPRAWLRDLIAEAKRD